MCWCALQSISSQDVRERVKVSVARFWHPIGSRRSCAATQKLSRPLLTRWSEESECYAAHGRVLSACARRRISATDTRERWDNWCQAITLKTHPNREIESRQRDGNRAHFSHSQSQSELSSHGQMRRRYILIRKKDGPIACRRFNFSQGIFLIVFNSNHKFFLHGKLRNSYFSKHSMNT